MCIPSPAIGLRGLALLTVTIAFALTLVDTGSVVLTTLSLPEDARRAGHAAAAAAENKPTTPQTPLVAYQAAQADARGHGHGLVISTEDFTVYPDGRVNLTAAKTSPTLLLDRLDALRHLAEVSATVTVQKLPNS